MGKVKSRRRCREQGCTIRPSFGPAGSKEKMYCSRHKHPDHIDVKHKRSQETVCDVIPTYGISGTKDAFVNDDVKSDLIYERENAILEAVSHKETVHRGDTTNDRETTNDETPAKRHQVKKFFTSSTATLKEVGVTNWNSDDDGWSSDGSAEDDTCLPYIDLYEDLDEHSI